jgi:hypothetical protein
MSQTTTLVLLPQTTFANVGNVTSYNVIGNQQPAASYYLGSRDLQTVALSTVNVTGNIFIEASLATSPASESDWFKVYELEANANASNGTPTQLASTTTLGVNIEGNFVWIRAKVEDFASGIIQYIKVSY